MTTSTAAFASIPFASGEHSEIRLALGNRNPLPSFDLERVDLFQAGPTPQLWTKYPRYLLRFVQRVLYVTPRMLPLVLFGIVLLFLARRGKTLAIILAVPVYYLIFQSVLHTEYRYIIGIHYFLFQTAAVAMYCFAGIIARGARLVAMR